MSNHTLVRGDTWSFDLTPIKRKGALVSLTSANAWCTIKRSTRDNDPGLLLVTEISSATGTITLVGTAALGATVSFKATATIALNAGEYHIDFQLKESDGTVTTLDIGKLKVRDHVTHST